MTRTLLQYIFLPYTVITIAVLAFNNPIKYTTIAARERNEEGIEFIEQDWDKALQQATIENKLSVCRYLCYLVRTM